MALLTEGFHIRVSDLYSALLVILVTTQEYFCIFGICDYVQQVLGEDVEGVWIIKGEDKDGCFREFVVAGGDAGYPLHPTGVPQLQFDLPVCANLEVLPKVIKAHC